MDVTGEVSVGFAEPCYLNIEKLKRKRRLEGNDTWIIYEEAEVLPPIPDNLN